MKKLLLTALTCVACIAGQAQNLYIIGAGVKNSSGVNSSWTTGTNQMTNEGNGIYTWTGQELKNEFKINDGSWNGQYNLGSNGSNLKLGTPYKVSNSGSSGNINFDGVQSVTNPTVTFNLNTMELTVTGGEDNSVSLSLAGSFNGNNQNDNSYALKETTANSNVFTGTFNFAPGSFTFQVIVNNSSWYGYTDNGTVDFSSSKTVTKSIGTGYQNDFTISDWPGGDITFTVNWTAKTVTLVANTSVAVEYPETLYLIGNFDGTGFTPDDGLSAKGTEGVYTYENVYMANSDGSEFAYFAFTKTLGANNDDWNTCNAGRYQAESADYKVVLGTPASVSAGSTNSWAVPTGTYNFTVDLTKSQLTVTAAEPVTTYPTLYLSGANINGAEEWGNAYDATAVDGVYTWNVETMYTKFKIHDEGWSAYNIGAAGGDEYSTLNFGEPFTYLNNENSVDINFTNFDKYLTNAKVVLDLNALTVTVTGTQNDAPLEAVYLAGSFSNWATNMADYELKSTDNNVYTNTFDLDEADPELQVVFVIGGANMWWGANSDVAYVEFEDGKTYNFNLVTAGNTNITLSGYTEGNLSFSVNYADKTLEIDAKSTGVEKIESAVKGADVIYNLQGVRVNNATKGLYIINGKKVLVK